MPFTITNDNSVITAIHAALVPSVPTGEIVYFAGFFGSELGRSMRYDCETGTVSPIDDTALDSNEDGEPDINLFCAGHAQLADGRWFVAGGSAPGGVIKVHEHGHGGTGIRDCFAYYPRAREWHRLACMHTQPNSSERGGGRWYPTLVTLADGQVLAVGGHPRAGDDSVADDYPTPDTRRHSNNTPERYSPTLDSWSLMLTERTAPDGPGVFLDEYDRLHLAPTGHVFFSTLAKSHGDTRLFDPYAGVFAGGGFGTHLDSAYDDANCSSRTTSVLLPILHGDTDNLWVFTCGGAQSERLNLKSGSPAWVSTGLRVWPGGGAAPVREHVLGIFLPTGQVFVAGGMSSTEPRTGIMIPEIYTPTIDWSTGKYTNGNGSWQTLGNEPSIVPRGYHSTALLMPDGRVWTAGSTDAGGNLTNPDESVQELRIEVYSPAYVNAADRPRIEEAPTSITYAETFTVRMQDGSAVHRVVLIRCGSFTHALDADQRYLTVSFKKSGSILTVTAPWSAALAPPGNYMLWVLRDANTPCERATFIRLAEQDCELILDRSTFSVLEVEAVLLEPNDEGLAEFEGAFYVFFDGFLPHELGLPTAEPDVTLTINSPSGPAAEGISVRLRETGHDDQTLPLDVAQRFTFLYDIRFDGTTAFDFSGTDQEINIHVSLADHHCDAKIRLTKNPNPYMGDGNPHWLSRDLRVFQIRPEEKVGSTTFATSDTPTGFIKRLLDDLDAQPDGPLHPFEQLPKGQEQSTLELATSVDGIPVYNFALAKVRYRAVAQPAENVRVLFRLFNTVGTALEWTSSTTYRREIKGAAGQDTVALLGVTGPTFGDIISIPFFAEPRVTPAQSMKNQPDAPNKRTLPGSGADETVRYFGCWLDFNQTTHHFPWKPSGDGPFSEDPYEGGPLSPLVDLVRNAHQCLVAEIYFEPDPVHFGDTPGSSDNISQRNLVTEMSSNPGVPATRRIQSTMLVRPTKIAPQFTASPLAGPGIDAQLAVRRRHPWDELVIFRKNLPPGTAIDVYIPTLKASDILRVAAFRQGASRLEQVDDHTVRCRTGTVNYIPLPGNLDRPVPALLSIQLPDTVQAGQQLRAVVQQYRGSTLRVIGSIEVSIPVRKNPDIIPGEIRKYTVLKYIKTRIPSSDIWWPVFDRYIREIEDRLVGLGVDPSTIEPSTHVGRQRPDEKRTPSTTTGRVAEILYDCAGQFSGFILEDCERRYGFDSCEPGFEAVIREACATRARLTVTTQAGQRRPIKVSRHCC
jgi:Galactose oxidase-like, Early set domain